jgi:hypothetical protein
MDDSTPELPVLRSEKLPDAVPRSEQHLAKLPDAEFDDFVKGQLKAWSELTINYRRHSLPYAINIGRALAVKKRKLPHGEYTKWVESIGLNQNTARLYKRMAEKGAHTLRKQNSNVTDLSIRYMRAAIAQPAKEPKPSAVQLRSRPRGLPAPAVARSKVPDLLMLLGDVRASLDPEEFYEQVLPELRRIVAECDQQRLAAEYAEQLRSAPEDPVGLDRPTT